MAISNLEQFSEGLTIEVVSSSKRYHTFASWKLRQLAPVSISAPVAKTHVIEDVAGIDGNIDITDEFGDVKFENRELQFMFDSLESSYFQWMQTLREIMNAIHGQKCRIIADYDKAYYWVGRVSVIPDTKDNILQSSLTISVDANPRMFRIGTTVGGVL